jgi:NADPH2 dehydrogenase
MGVPDPKPQFSYLVSQLRKHDLAYLHVTEPRVGGNLDVDAPSQGSSNDFLREIWCKEGKNGVFISAGGYTRQTAIETAQEHGGMIAFGRLYIPNVSPLCFQVHYLIRRVLTTFSSCTWINICVFPLYHYLLSILFQQPDLPARLIYDMPLAKPDRAIFYLAGDHTGKGYIDFPAADVSAE